MPESQEEKLGYHKGALEALINERNELSRLMQIVDSLIETHGQALQQAGIDVQEFIDKLAADKEKKAKQAQQMQQQQQQTGSKNSQQQSGDRGGREPRQAGGEAGQGGRHQRKGQGTDNRASGGQERGSTDEVEIEGWLED